MTAVATIKGTQLQIKMGNGESPETFAEWCMINTTRGVQWAITGTDEEIPDCADPDAMAWTKFTKTGASGTISGAGKLDTGSLTEVWDWLISDDPKNVRIYVNTLGYWEGAWKLTEFNPSGDRGSVAQATLTMKSHGVQTWVPTP